MVKQDVLKDLYDHGNLLQYLPRLKTWQVKDFSECVMVWIQQELNEVAPSTAILKLDLYHPSRIDELLDIMNNDSDLDQHSIGIMNDATAIGRMLPVTRISGLCYAVKHGIHLEAQTLQYYT